MKLTSWVAVPLAALLLFAAPRSTADAGGEPPADTRCICRTGNACYHWLNAPVTVPVDPCSCPNCRQKKNSCPKIYPTDWNLGCARSSKMECFLRRHGVSWKLRCSAEMGRCECPGSDSANCPRCAPGGEAIDAKWFDRIVKQVALEKKVLDGDFIAVTSPHFYLVTDIASLKVLTQNGNRREAGMHEVAHLFIQRAELAYQDFVRVFGEEIRTSRPIAIFLNRRKGDSERVQTEYFGRATAGLVYGLRKSAMPISGNFAEAGIAADLESQTSDDALHVKMRTSIGHVLLSLWHSGESKPSHLPMWAFVGAGHWLGRLPPAFADQAAFIGGEGNCPEDEGKDWHKKLAKELAKSDFPHVDTFLGFTTLSQTDLVTHMRAWSWFSLALEEDRDRFVKLLKLVREGRNQREAFREATGGTPDEFDLRWRDRVSGRTKTLVEVPKGSTPPAGAAGGPSPAPAAPAGSLADIGRETEPATIAARIKARPLIDDPADAAALVGLLDRDSDLVRERVVLALAAAKDDGVQAWLRDEGLARSNPKLRAGVARIVGLAKDKDAAETLVRLCTDPDPEVREQAAVAIGRLRHEPAIGTLTAMVGDREDDVAMAAMDALGSFGGAAEDAWTKVAERLSDPHRTVRTASADCLGALGTMEAIDALIARMEAEDGRVHSDCREALKQIARDDLGNDASRWKDWWKKEKERAQGQLPGRPPPKPPEDPNKRYGEQQAAFYGVQIYSKVFAFVLDVSSSMNDRIVVDPQWLRAQGRKYVNDATKYDMAVTEIAATLHSVDPRAQFNLITFRTDVKAWKERPVMAGASGTVDQAMSYLNAQRPPPTLTTGYVGTQKTDLVDALRIALGIRPGGSGRPSEDTADEVFVMTDGMPTAGDLTEPDVLLSWFRERQRSARLKLHVVTFETINTDLTFLRALAAAGGGVFVAIPEVKR